LLLLLLLLMMMLLVVVWLLLLWLLWLLLLDCMMRTWSKESPKCSRNLRTVLPRAHITTHTHIQHTHTHTHTRYWCPTSGACKGPHCYCVKPPT
jgi:hypothetical protein